MNNDLISRSALLEKRFKMHSNFLGSVPVVTVKDIEEAPAVDAVEVVRYKSCILWDGQHIEVHPHSTEHLQPSEAEG